LLDVELKMCREMQRSGADCLAN